MREKNMNAFVIAGTHSGCGKTTLSLALMAFFSSKGLRVQPFKVGPDFIDPGLHSRITGKISRNLDGWMLSEGYNRSLFSWASRDVDVAIVEGVMGFYDGFDGKSEAGSTAQMAKLLGLPVVLVVDCRSMARSVAAIVHGFINFDPDIRWAGVILNRVAGEGHFRYLNEALSTALPHIPVLGWIPSDEDLKLPERHLGLVTAQESPIDERWIKKAKEAIVRYINIERLLSETVFSAKPLEPPFYYELEHRPKRTDIRIAVSRDAAFCFFYEDNLDFLRAFGAELQFFSPLEDQSIPSQVDAIVLWGGYPELHLERLTENRAFFRDLLNSFQRKVPIYAECGGLMTLSRFIEDWEGKRWPMAGILPFGTRMLKRRKALGYVEVELLKECMLGPTGTVVKGHEFHYSEICNIENNPNMLLVYKLSRRKSEDYRNEGYLMGGSLLASYVHQHWGSNPEVPRYFIDFLSRRKLCLEQNL
ncbi:MAG: cobyrinate a,c-diamide synthase [Syntrophobacterales bacterium]|nr:cobyrinate a,c-diamide synthase [Syntrophobacterales bacterium]